MGQGKGHHASHLVLTSSLRSGLEWDKCSNEIKSLDRLSEGHRRPSGCHAGTTTLLTQAMERRRAKHPFGALHCQAVPWTHGLGSNPSGSAEWGIGLQRGRMHQTSAYLCTPQVRNRERSLFHWGLDRKTWFGQRPLPALAMDWPGMGALISNARALGWRAMACLEDRIFRRFQASWHKHLIGREERYRKLLGV